MINTCWQDDPEIIKEEKNAGFKNKGGKMCD